MHSTGASNDTGGDSHPAKIAEIARKRGLHFVVLTDHSNSTGSDVNTREENPALFNLGPEFPTWEIARKLSVPGKFLMVSGNELSPVAVGDPAKRATGHIGCLPRSLTDFDRKTPFIDRPRGKVTGGDALAQASKRGCFTVLNHPYGPAVWVAYDWTSLKYDAMEIWNGGLGYDAYDQVAHKAWRCDLLQGRKVTPVAASDNHRVNTPPPGQALHPALGWPMISIWAKALHWPDLLQGMSDGKVALHEGNSFLQIDGYDGDKRRQEGAGMKWIRLRGQLDARAGKAVLSLHLTTSCQDFRPALKPPELSQVLVHRQTVQPGASLDVSIQVKASKGVYTAVLSPHGAHYHALSRAIVLR